jgi:circadian clock protein KaiC
LRLLAQDALKYRRQVLALKQFFSTQGCTVWLLDDKTSQLGDLQLHSITHGVIELDQRVQEYGVEQRRLRVVKMRGVKFAGGHHDFKLDTGGITIYPRLVAAQHRREFETCPQTTGVPEPGAGNQHIAGRPFRRGQDHDGGAVRARRARARGVCQIHAVR